MSKTKVLIADDHWVVIEGIKRLLDGHSEYEVVGEAFNGREAVELAFKARPNIVILDISMPDLDGIQVTREIKRIDPDIHVIIYTMHSEQENIVHLFQEGMSGYVLKGGTVAELVNALDAVRQGGTYFCGVAPMALADHLKRMEVTKGNENELACLSPRERQVFDLLADGKSMKIIAEQMCLSPKTVESHKYSIMKKLSVSNVADLTKLAIRHGIIRV